MKQKSKIVFTEEILKEVSKNLDMDLEVVRGVYTSITDYLEYLVKYTDTVSIKLPMIGVIYINFRNVHIALNTHKKRGSKEEIIKAYEGKLKKLKEFVGQIDKKYKDTGEYTQIYHRFNPMYFEDYFTKGKTLEEIEELQNNR